MATNLELKLQDILTEKTKKIKSENIKKGVTIFGVEGTASGGIEPIHIHRDATPAPTVTITVQNDDLYGFIEDVDGWYKNNNQNIDDSVASARFIVNASDATSIDVFIEQYSELNCDYGTLNGISYPELNGQHVETINLDKGENIIVASYRKDSSVSNDTDTFRIKFDLSSVEGIEEVDEYVYVTHFASMEDMRNDDACPINTYAITYIDTLEANVYKKTNAGWVFVGVSNNSKFVHNNVVRGVKIGELIGSYIPQSELNDFVYDKLTGNLTCNLSMDIDVGVNISLSTSNISIAPNGVGTLTISYWNHGDVEIPYTVKATGETGAFSVNNHDMTTVTHLIPNCDRYSTLSQYIDADLQWRNINHSITIDERLSGVTGQTVSAQYSPVINVIRVDLVHSNTSNTHYEAEVMINGASVASVTSYPNSGENFLNIQTIVNEEPIECVVHMRYSGKLFFIDQSSIRTEDIENPDSYVQLTYNGQYTESDTSKLYLNVYLELVNVENKGYFCEISFVDTNSKKYKKVYSGTYSTSEYVEFELSAPVTTPIEFQVDLRLLDVENKVLMDNGTLPVNNYQGTELLKLNNVHVEGDDINGYRFTGDTLDSNYPSGMSVSVEDTDGIKYITALLSPPCMFQFGMVKKLSSGFFDNLLLIGKRHGYIDDYDYDYNEAMEKLSDNSATLNLSDVDLTNEFGFRVQNIILTLYADNSNLNITYDVLITNKELLYQKAIPPVIQNKESIADVEFLMNETYLKANGEVIMNNFNNISGTNGDQSTYFSSSGGGFTRGLDLLQSYTINFAPRVLNENLTLVGPTGLLAQTPDVILFTVQDGWVEANNTYVPAYKVTEGANTTSDERATFFAYWHDDEVSHKAYIDVFTYDYLDSEWYVRLYPHCNDATQSLLQNGNGDYMAYNALTATYVKVLDYTEHEETICYTPYWNENIFYGNLYGYDTDGNIYTECGFSTLVE